MITQSLNSSQSNEEDVIVWMPFVVKMKHLQLPLMTPMPAQSQPIPVQEVQQIAPPAPLPHTIPQKQHAQYGEGKTTRKGPATEKQMNTVLSIAKQLNMTEAEVCRLVGAKSYSEMSNAQAHGFIASHNEMQPQF